MPKRQEIANHHMVELVERRTECKAKSARIDELESCLNRAILKIETLSDKYSDNTSAYLVAKLRGVLE